MKELEVITQEEKGRKEVKSIVIKGEALDPTPRFFQSVFSRFGFNKQVFRYFGHEETFLRISEVAPSDKLLCCIERDDEGNSRLLATSNPKKTVVQYDDLLELLTKHAEGSPLDYNYHEGVVRSTHAPRFSPAWEVGGDQFMNRFTLDTPIDGYGKPSIYLSVLREICTNQAVAQAPAFRSHLSLGKGEDSFDFPIARALEGFNNEEGFDALRQRLFMAQHSWASIFETQQLYKRLIQAHSRGLMNVQKKFLVGEDKEAGDGEKLVEASPIIKSFNKLTGNISEAYGLANLDALTKKKQRTLPAPGVKVYDLLNFATEVATHKTQKGGDRFLQTYVGEVLGSGDEYDLEGTFDKFPDWRDFLATDEAAQDAQQTLQGLKI
jgi:hypothetical protein